MEIFHFIYFCGRNALELSNVNYVSLLSHLYSSRIHVTGRIFSESFSVFSKQKQHDDSAVESNWTRES